MTADAFISRKVMPLNSVLMQGNRTAKEYPTVESLRSFCIHQSTVMD